MTSELVGVVGVGRTEDPLLTVSRSRIEDTSRECPTALGGAALSGCSASDCG